MKPSNLMFTDIKTNGEKNFKTMLRRKIFSTIDHFLESRMIPNFGHSQDVLLLDI